MSITAIYTIFFVFLIGLTSYKNINDIHMFQQNSYRPERYFRWYSSKVKFNLKDSDMMLIIGVFAFLGAGFIDSLPVSIALLIFGVLICIISVYMYNFRLSFHGPKKKLVYTNRVKRILGVQYLVHFIILLVLLRFVTVITGSITSFAFTTILLIGLCINSFTTMIVSYYINEPIESHIKNKLVNETKDILRSNKKLIVIGVTGSYGKTSVKNIMYHLLSKKYNVLMTPESYNTTWGIVRTVREQLKPTHQVFIAEMGAREIGDIKEICEIVSPKYTLITSIGPQHLETFKTLDNIISTKGEIFKHTIKDGFSFVNIADENIIKVPRRDDVNYIEFGKTSKGHGKYYYDNVKVTSRGTNFDLIVSENGKEMSYNLTTKLLGMHNIENLLSCIAIALELGVDPNHLNMLLYDIEPIKHRLSYTKSSNGYMIIDDAFNSNPVGSKSALEVLKAMEGNNKIVMTPGMIELGDEQENLNYQFGKYIADACDFVVLVGPKQTLPIQNGLKDAGYPQNRIYIAKNLNDAFNKVNSIIGPNDVLLIENDLPDTFNE